MAYDCAMIRSAFSEAVESLLVGLLEVFPECQATRTTMDAFVMFVKGNKKAEHSMISTFGECVENGTQIVRSKDEEALLAAVERIPVLRGIGIRTKWNNDLDQPSKDNLWHHMKVLNAYAKVYASVPDAVMSKVESVLRGVGEGTEPLDMLKAVEQVTASFADAPTKLEGLSEETARETISALTDLVEMQAPHMQVGDMIQQLMAKVGDAARVNAALPQVADG